MIWVSGHPPCLPGEGPREAWRLRWKTAPTHHESSGQRRLVLGAFSAWSVVDGLVVRWLEDDPRHLRGERLGSLQGF